MAKEDQDVVPYFTIPSDYVYDYWNEEYTHRKQINGKTVELELIPADVWFRAYYYHYE